MPLQDDQTPIFQQLTLALVEATPEWWTFASLVLEAPQTASGKDWKVYRTVLVTHVIPVTLYLRRTRFSRLQDCWS